ncbi:uncharacterized protein BXIN_2864 [Babesia sp. Xinjiang]|uniref:uncharacterized protein n=1 Tax=Babesia sp. Xinjiang TaxID=462227 RepID=UPI000A218D95|nr:uncharacterized protein BXIN_2864 [Babesia sp. Xinjiang]ORM39345.1 hypothetical protein BXIN_2864 [Babesia sp. Xinjiang]
MRAGYILVNLICYFSLVSAFLLRKTTRNAEQIPCLRVKGFNNAGGEYLSNTQAFNSTPVTLIDVSEVNNATGTAETSAISSRNVPTLEPVAELIGLKRKDKLPQIKVALGKTKLSWAEWEIRRFGYKLGTANKQMRKLAERYKAMRNTFTCSQEDLNKLSKEKHEVSIKIRISSRLRRLFITYRNGLLSDSQPKVPYVPLKYRSENAPAEFYALGKRDYTDTKSKRELNNKHRQVAESVNQQENEARKEYCHIDRLPTTRGKYVSSVTEGPRHTSINVVPHIQDTDEDSVVSTRKRSKSLLQKTIREERNNDNQNSENRLQWDHQNERNTNSSKRTGADIEREILGLIAQAKNQAVVKRGLVNNPAVAKIQEKYRKNTKLHRHRPKAL